MATTSIDGGGNHDVNVYSGSIIVGNGNNNLNITTDGDATVGSGSNTIYLGGSGSIVQNGVAGQDTITLGNGNDTMYVAGQATVVGAGAVGGVAASTFGSASISGGVLAVNHLHGVTQDVALSGNMTLLGGAATTEFIGGTGNSVMTGASGYDTFIGGSGHDTMSGVGGHNVFDFITSQQFGQHVIMNFVSTDELYVNGQSLAYLQAHNEVTVQNGNTYITADAGKTSIELEGVTNTKSI